MYFSFNSIPNVKRLPKDKKKTLYRKLVRELNIASRHASWMLIAFAMSIVMAGVLVEKGARGDSLGYICLGTALIIWTYGYLRTLNKVIAPRIKDFLE